VHHVGIQRGVRELFVNKPEKWRTASDRRNDTPRGRWSVFFRDLASYLWKCSERCGFIPWRKYALDRAESLLIEHVAPSQLEGLKFRELLWHVIALHAIGYSDESPERQLCEARLHELIRFDDDNERAFPQQCVTPFLDTLAAVRALRASGLSGQHPSIAAASKWLSRWKRSDTAPEAIELSGVVRLLHETAEGSAAAQNALPPRIEVGNDRWRRDPIVDADNRFARLRWLSRSLIERLLQQQSRDGGWGAPDITGTVLEAIAACPRERARAAVPRAIEYLRATQRADGSWPASPGDDGDVHATSVAIRGLLAAGLADDDDTIAAALNWLTVHQRPGGDWAGSSSSQTASALLALTAAGRAARAAALRAANFLLDSQQDDGGWRHSPIGSRSELAIRCLSNDVHTVTLPLEALSRWLVAAKADQPSDALSPSLRLVAAADDT
jgi:hypothetical protein